MYSLELNLSLCTAITIHWILSPSSAPTPSPVLFTRTPCKRLLVLTTGRCWACLKTHHKRFNSLSESKIIPLHFHSSLAARITNDAPYPVSLHPGHFDWYLPLPCRGCGSRHFHSHGSPSPFSISSPDTTDCVLLYSLPIVIEDRSWHTTVYCMVSRYQSWQQKCFLFPTISTISFE